MSRLRLTIDFNNKRHTKVTCRRDWIKQNCSDHESALFCENKFVLTLKVVFIPLLVAKKLRNGTARNRGVMFWPVKGGWNFNRIDVGRNKVALGGNGWMDPLVDIASFFLEEGRVYIDPVVEDWIRPAGVQRVAGVVTVEVVFTRPDIVKIQLFPIRAKVCRLLVKVQATYFLSQQVGKRLRC